MLQGQNLNIKGGMGTSFYLLIEMNTDGMLNCVTKTLNIEWSVAIYFLAFCEKVTFA